MAVTGFPKRQLVGEDIDLCEAPLDDSLEPRFPDWTVPSVRIMTAACTRHVPAVAQRQPFTKNG
jgi:hypothetical protein